MQRTRIGIVALLAGVVVVAVATAGAAQTAVPAAGSPGQWRMIGHIQARQTVDHDTIFVHGPFDSFRRVKFRVTNSPLQIHRMVVSYENGAPDRIDVRQRVAKGGESRAIDLRGAGKRSIRKIEFWYETAGMVDGRAEVMLFGMK